MLNVAVLDVLSAVEWELVFVQIQLPSFFTPILIIPNKSKLGPAETVTVVVSVVCVLVVEVHVSDSSLVKLVGVSAGLPGGL
jgi:hypothetical protein